MDNKNHSPKSEEELRQQFYQLNTREEIAAMLGIDDNTLRYYLYAKKSYKTFTIKKKSGGERTIAAPTNNLKLIQKKLNQVLQAVYEPHKRPSVHGFVPNSSIVTNAEFHAKRRYVLNIDLENFFPTITFRRVRGMFSHKPYSRNLNVATILAQICCYLDALPQGAPTSPIVANMVCARLDGELQRFANTHKCNYTRYADDITFSTYTNGFPPSVALYDPITYTVELGASLRRIIENDNKFIINNNKVRLQTKDRRQEVTGLTVNKFPNVQHEFIREVRAMLHDWKNLGHEKAQERFVKRFDKKHRSSEPLKKDLFKQVLTSKIEYIGMVKGKTNLTYIYYREELDFLDKGIVKSSKPSKPQLPQNYWALLVGVDIYADNNYRTLKVCKRDVGKLEKTLLQGGYRDTTIKILTDFNRQSDISKLPTLINIRRSLKDIAEKAKKEDTLLFYYSGHGDNDGTESYLVTRDGYQDDLSGSALSITEITNILQRSEARAKIIILDACHSGVNLKKGSNPVSKDFFDRVLKQTKGLVVLASCSFSEGSQWLLPSQGVGSVFTHYLDEALNHKAITRIEDGSSIVLANDVHIYVSNQVSSWVKLNKRLKQTPTINSQIVGGDIILCYYPPTA